MICVCVYSWFSTLDHPILECKPLLDKTQHPHSSVPIMIFDHCSLAKLCLNSQVTAQCQSTHTWLELVTLL